MSRPMIARAPTAVSDTIGCRLRLHIWQRRCGSRGPLISWKGLCAQFHQRWFDTVCTVSS